MPNSPYLDIDRDLDALRQLIDEYEAEKKRKQDCRDIIERTLAPRAGNAWEPVYPKPVALAS